MMVLVKNQFKQQAAKVRKGTIDRRTGIGRLKGMASWAKRQGMPMSVFRRRRKR
jgi:hypothetical protein